MSEFDYGNDKFLAPFVLDQTNNKVAVIEAGVGTTVVTISAGRYWHHNDSTVDGYGYNSFLLELSSAMSSQLTYTYNVIASRTSSIGVNSFAISQQENAGQFTLDFGDPNSTIDRRLFGLKRDTIAKSSSDFILSPEISVRTTYQPTTIIEGNGKAVNKTSWPVKNIVLSSDDVSAAGRINYKNLRMRGFEYRYVPGAAVRLNRGLDPVSAEIAGLVEGDINNSFEDFWDFATRSGEDGKMPKVIVVHDVGWETIEVDFGDWEVVRFSDKSQIKDPSNIWSLNTPNGELYDLDFETQIVNEPNATYDQ